MLAVVILVASLSQLPETEFSTGSRALFEELAKLEIKRGRLVVRLKAASHNASGIRVRALGLFPGVSRVSVRTNHGSTSTSRGSGSGQVSIRVGDDGGASTLAYELTAGGGAEKVILEQRSGGELKIEIESRGSYVRLEQTGNKCSLRIKVGQDRLHARGSSLAAIFQVHPIGAREHLFGAIKRYFGDPPFTPVSSAPPGKTIVRLRDGAEIVCEVQLEAVVLETDYGRLTIPRSDVYHVFFPGAGPLRDVEPAGRPANAEGPAPSGESLVITPRFTPRGRIDLETLSVSTPYGDLEIDTRDILHIVFGAVRR